MEFYKKSLTIIKNDLRDILDFRRIHDANARSNQS